MKPPIHPDHPEYANPGFIHWDLDLHPPEPGKTWVQGVVALTDTAADQGGFQCVPSVFQQFCEMRHLTGRGARQPPPGRGSAGAESRADPLQGGRSDHLGTCRLLHGNGMNRSHRPRLAQDITIEPRASGRRRTTIAPAAIDAWKNRDTPGGRAFPGDPRGVEQERYQTAELTPLGRCLLGVDEWPSDVA